LALRGVSAHSFQIKLIAAALTAQLAMLAVLIWQGWNLMDSQLREVLRGNVEQNNTLLVAALGSPLAQRDYAAIGDLLDKLVEGKMLDYIVVEDHRQRRVAAAGWPAEQALPEANQGIESTRSGQLHVRQQIAFSGEQLGEVQYGLSLGFLNKARAMLASNMLRIGAVGIVLGLALLVLLTLWLLRRLSVLEDAAQRLADGDLGQRITLSGNDELARLARAFNNMADSIARMVVSLRRSEARFHHAVQGSNDGIWDWDLEGEEYYFSPRHKSMLGYADDEIPNRRDAMEQLIHPDDRQSMQDAIERHFTEREPFAIEVRLRHKDGHYLWCSSRGQAVWNNEGRVIRFAGATTDVSERHRVQDQLVHMAHFDPLTHLPNRMLLGDRIDMALSRARRHGSRVCVGLLDLDGFKPVNDSFGHEAGDRVLVEVAGRLRAAVRGADTVARLGGDEFVLVLGGAVDKGREAEGGEKIEYEGLLSRVLQALSEPFAVDSTRVSLSASIGVTFFPDDDADSDTLLRHADQAMYVAKQSGRNRFHVFDAAVDRDVRTRREARERIEAALAAGEFVLHYQPKVNMRTGCVTGAEALIRWRHPHRGLLSPAEFLPLIEGTELDVAVSEWVIDAALRQMESWQRAGLDLRVSVNIPARHLQETRFVPYLREALARYPTIEAASLELEVIESAALADVVGVSGRMEECRQLGFRFALDDFGTGYASLAYLRRLPVELLKIDQSFVRDMLHDADDLAIVEGVISLAMAFRDEVIAEGVETIDHGIMLMHLGCDLAQGYGISRPLPAETLPGWVSSWRRDPAWAVAANVQLARRDLVLAYVEVEHRSWVDAIASWLAGRTGVASGPPSLASDTCRFGQWLTGDGRTSFGELATFKAIDHLHESAHELGRELARMAGDGHAEQARQRLPELFACRDELIVELHKLIADVTSAR
jgi:diguanylate cyclase (GGDEF)-like protein/PAS domain S-box-containing protein